MDLHLRRVFVILAVSCLAAGLSACATPLLEENSKLSEEKTEETEETEEPVEPTLPTDSWQLNDATVEEMVKSGRLVINWMEPAITVEDPNTRTTIGEGGTGGTGTPGLNPVEDRQLLLKIYRTKWDTLRAKMEPRPYVYSKGTSTDFTKDYKTGRVKEVYDWWFFDGTQNRWRMRKTHEQNDVILIIDRYWNNEAKWRHTSLDEDKARWLQKP